jgi:hypothetical protein
VLKKIGPLRVVYGDPKTSPISLIAELEGKVKYYGTALTIDEYERSVRITLPTGSSYKIGVRGMEAAVPVGGLKYGPGADFYGNYLKFWREYEFNIDFLQIDYSTATLIHFRKLDNIYAPSLRKLREWYPAVPWWQFVPAPI